jgi:hypothetical protein
MFTTSTMSNSPRKTDWRCLLEQIAELWCLTETFAGADALLREHGCDAPLPGQDSL